MSLTYTGTFTNEDNMSYVDHTDMQNTFAHPDTHSENCQSTTYITCPLRRTTNSDCCCCYYYYLQRKKERSEEKPTNFHCATSCHSGQGGARAPSLYLMKGVTVVCSECIEALR